MTSKQHSPSWRQEQICQEASKSNRIGRLVSNSFSCLSDSPNPCRWLLHRSHRCQMLLLSLLQLPMGWKEVEAYGGVVGGVESGGILARMIVGRAK